MQGVLRLMLIFFFVNIFADDKININFSNLSLKEFVKITSKILNKDILITEELDMKLDFVSNKALNKKDLLKILTLSLEDKGYFLEDKKSFFKITKLDKEKKEEYLTKIYELKNLEAENLIKILENLIEKNIYEESYFKPIVSFDIETNSIILMGVEKEINKILNFLKEIDKQKAQVYIQAKIIEVNNELVDKIGFSYGILKGNASSSGIEAISAKLNGGSNAIDEAISSLAWNIKNLNIKSGLALGASLNLLKQKGALDIVSEPSILAINNKESFIYVGEKISVQTSSTITDGGTQRTNYQREDVGLSLKVKPRVTSDEKLILQLTALLEGVKLKSVGAGANPDTLKKEINTTAILSNGESVIIGGLIENKSEKLEEKVPLLGDLPILGAAFKSDSNINKKNNLVVIVTPYIVPKDKDLSYIRDKLSQLKNLEDSYLENALQSLETKEENIKEQKKEVQTLHEQRLKEFFEQ